MTSCDRYRLITLYAILASGVIESESFSERSSTMLITGAFSKLIHWAQNELNQYIDAHVKLSPAHYLLRPYQASGRAGIK